MEALIKKRIEEAAIEYSFNIPSELFHSLQTQHERKLWKDEIEQAYIYGGEDSLQNQWISVEEALPPYDDRLKTISIDVIVRNEYGKATSAWYDYANKVWHLLYGEIAGDDVLVSKITHWMCIPSLEGGEK